MWVTSAVRREAAERAEKGWRTIVSRVHVGADSGGYYWVPAAYDNGNSRHGDEGWRVWV